MNVGDGDFAPHADATIGRVGSTTIAVGDITDDGLPDILAGGDDGQGLAIVRNPGEGMFYFWGYDPGYGTFPTVVLGDLDGDGANDMIVADRRAGDPNANGDLAVRLLRPLNGGLYSELASRYAAGVEPHAVALADLNGDGHLDVVVAGRCGGGVLLNNGDGHLASLVRYDVLTGSLALADVDRDGRTDIIDTEPDQGTVAVLLNRGMGVFAPAIPNMVQSPLQSPLQAVMGDVNGDGSVDIVVATQTSDHGITVLLNDGGFRFAAPLNYAVDDPGPYPKIALADVDGDGKLDIVAAGEKGVTVFMNRSR